jgi:hypothetical protein
MTQALAAGKEVITHTDRISVPGWTGEGYILLDPVLGDGAYKITGGANGGYATNLASLYSHVGARVTLQEFADALSPITRVFAGALLGVELGHVFTEILDDCGPQIALTLTAIDGFLSYFLAEASTVLALSGVGLLAGIFIAVLGWLFNYLLEQFIVSLSTQLCRLARRQDRYFGYA